MKKDGEESEIERKAMSYAEKKVAGCGHRIPKFRNLLHLTSVV